MPLDSRKLQSRVNKLRKSLNKFPKNPTVDQVHDLRTRTRRVESILHGLELDRSSNETTLLDELKPIRSRAGKVRDMDVLTAHIVGVGLKDDPDCVVRLVHHLGLERGRHAIKLHAGIQRDAQDVRSRLKKTRRKLDAAVVRSEQSRTALDSDGKAGEAPLHAVSTALRLSQELANVRKLGKSNLHSYRIEIKRLRYVLEMADSDSGPRHHLIGELTEVQDAIGEWHDWLELGGIAHHVLQHGRGCKLLKIIERTTERKFREALQIAEQMRRRYLRPPARGGRSPRQNETVPIAGPLLVAASEIAA